MTMMKMMTAALGVAMLAGVAYAQAPADSNRAAAAESNRNAAANGWRVSKLTGLAVHNPQNEKIGEIEELLIDQSGRVRAVVLGVGGFLGMGEHDVAVPFTELKWVEKAVRTTGTGGTTTTTEHGYPEHGVLNMSKDQLKALPQFKYPD
jgi:sporulation protein YlmC with PRC-barrel domain